MEKGPRKRIVAGCIGMGALVAVGIGFMVLCERAKVADIISDEAAWDYRDSLAEATGMKVALLQNGHWARVLDENETTYLCGIQDTFSVRKSEVTIEFWSAADGKGIVLPKRAGSFPAYSKPDNSSGIVTYIVAQDGELPETFRCMGLSDGWFEIDAGGRPAYIEVEKVCWDALDTY